MCQYSQLDHKILKSDHCLIICHLSISIWFIVTFFPQDRQVSSFWDLVYFSPLSRYCWFTPGLQQVPRELPNVLDKQFILFSIIFLFFEQTAIGEVYLRCMCSRSPHPPLLFEMVHMKYGNSTIITTYNNV